MPGDNRSRKKDILRAAEREFASAGYAGARIERIATAAGVNKQLLFHYYESKEGLFTASVAALLGRLHVEADPTQSPASEVRGVVTGLLRGLRVAPGVVGIVAGIRSDQALPAAAAALVRDWRDRLIKRLMTAVADGQRRGYFRDDIDPHAVSAVATAAAVGLVVLELDRAMGAHAARDGSEQTLTEFLTDYCAWR